MSIYKQLMALGAEEVSGLESGCYETDLPGFVYGYRLKLKYKDMLFTLGMLKEVVGGQAYELTREQALEQLGIMGAVMQNPVEGRGFNTYAGTKVITLYTPKGYFLITDTTLLLYAQGWYTDHKLLAFVETLTGIYGTAIPRSEQELLLDRGFELVAEFV